MTELEELKARIKELEKENKKLKQEKRKFVKSLEEQISRYNELNNSFIQKNADYIELEQLRTECKRKTELADTLKKSIEREEQQHERTRKSYEMLKKQYETLKNQLQESNNSTDKENNNIDKQSYTLLEASDCICISPLMQDSDVKKIQETIEKLTENLNKVGIKMHLTNDKLFTCFFNAEKMKKIAVRNKNGAKKKIPKTNKPSGEYLTYDDVKEMMKEQTAEQVANQLGFTKMTLYRKLKQAEQRENKLFY